MKATLKSTMIIAALWAMVLDGVALGATKAKDPTKYDCRETTGYKRVFIGRAKVPRHEPIYACPHKDKMAAGQCETSWLSGSMRCKS
jgi:hypothetical protein